MVYSDGGKEDVYVINAPSDDEIPLATKQSTIDTPYTEKYVVPARKHDVYSRTAALHFERRTSEFHIDNREILF